MTIDFLLNSNHDMYWDGKDFAIVSGLAEVAQAAKIRILFIQAEWVFDITKGLPWFDEMFSTAFSYERKRQWLLDTIAQTRGVKNIIEFKFDVDPINRGALVEFEALTDNGETLIMTGA